MVSRKKKKSTNNFKKPKKDEHLARLFHLKPIQFL